MSIDVRLGDCRDLMPTLPDQSIDCVLCDPPYPMIRRPYGMLTEEQWWSLMMDVCREARRVLKPTGSAVFILQPNSRKVGSMRGWLFEFQAWACREWNMVQDAWWWNVTILPNGGAPCAGLLRGSLKACVWLGPPDCYRDQNSVLDRSEKAWMRRRWDQEQPDDEVELPSGNRMNRGRCLASVQRRGGTIPFNVLPMGNGNRHNMAGMHGHGAGTPLNLADWWTRYISPIDGVVCDPFCGSGTTGIAAYRRHRSFVGFESMPEYHAIAARRLAAEADRYALFGAMDDADIGVAAS